MDRYTHGGDAAERPDEGPDAVRIAETVRNDFAALVEILDRQLGTASEGDCKTLSHIAEARSAAERGVELSNRLLEMLRSAS